MYVAETFSSLQGEGILCGVPSFFIRSSGCNLRCRWCDTPYTSWLPEGCRRPLQELLAELAESRLEHVVLTGGEPLLQRELASLCRAVRAAGCHLTVETAGTLAPDFECDLLSLSPKMSNSDPPGTHRQRHQRLRRGTASLRRLLEAHPEHQVKFVVQAPEDLDEVLQLLPELPVRAPDRVLLMAEGRTAEEVAGRASWVASLCVEHGFRYTPRLHLDLFGGGRGV